MLPACLRVREVLSGASFRWLSGKHTPDEAEAKTPVPHCGRLEHEFSQDRRQVKKQVSQSILSTPRPHAFHQSL